MRHDVAIKSLPAARRISLRAACFGTLFSLAVGGGPALAEEPSPPAPTAKPADRASRSLFDGKTLDNWTATDFGTKGTVQVDAGLLVVSAGEPLNGVTWNGPKLPRVDYEISLEAQRVAGSDFFCALTFPVQESPCTLILGGWGGSLTGLSSLNHADASENETTDFFDFENGKWYEIRLRVTPRKISAWIGETTLCDVEYAGKKIDVRFEMEPCKPLGLATYRTTGAFRKITLQELTPQDQKPPPTP